MAQLNLRSVLVNPVDAPASGVSVRAQRIDINGKALGSVVNTGPTGRRAVTWEAQSTRVLNMRLAYNDRDGALQLARWLGRVVIVRDLCGMVAVGLLASVATIDQADMSTLQLVPETSVNVTLVTHPLATI